jgi:tetratricopeptide (TPR) repeat protein
MFGFMYRKIVKSLIAAGIFLVAPVSMMASSENDSVASYIQQGKELQGARKYADAWRFYEKAAKVEPNNKDAQLGIVEVCTKMNRMAPAIKALEDVYKAYPQDEQVLWKLVKVYFKFGQYQKVIDLAPQVEKRKPDGKSWDYMLGKSYFSIQNYGKGIQHLQRALKEDEENADALYLIGHMFTLMSNYKPAIPYYEKALALDQENSYSIRVYEFAMVLATAGEYDKSVKWFQTALDKGFTPRDDFYMNYAYTLADARKTDEAITMMENMLKRRPMDIALLNSLADICYHSGRLKQAISYWDKVLAMDEKNARPLYQIGLAYIKMGNTTDGQQLCDRAIAMDPALGVLKHERRMQ